MENNLRQILLVLLVMFSLGCGTNHKVISQDHEESLATIKKAVVHVIGEPRFISQNQREFFGAYVKVTPTERYYTKVLILGARRPYSLEVSTIFEKKNGTEYVHDRYDKAISNKVISEIKTRLNQSRDEGNVIDDFRAF
jgi:hypothetical protein